MRILLLFSLFFTLPALAYDSGDHETSAQIYDASTQAEKPWRKITKDDQYLYIRSNGIPNHDVGAFPNSLNPNAIRPQNHSFRIPLDTVWTGRATPKKGIIGVALNGIPFEPGTAECYRPPYGWISGDECEWREEAIVKNKRRLGLDDNNAHVQPDGTYHYHGIPTGLISADLTHVGFAADGYRIIVSRSGRFKSSWRLRRGFRSSGPGGPFSGKYTADFEYKKGSGDLDACNGTTYDGEYLYVITEDFPFLPRCLAGIADPSFERERPPPRSRMRPRGALPPVQKK